MAASKSGDVSFKYANSFEARLEESSRIREKFPGRIPVIVERSARSLTVPVIDKQKFLVPGDLSVSQFIFVIRRRLNLPPEQALFIFVGNTLPTTGILIRELHASYADKDGFLYVTYCGENVFG
jgi:GABA(A) receptor-associated protein